LTYFLQWYKLAWGRMVNYSPGKLNVKTGPPLSLFQFEYSFGFQ